LIERGKAPAVRGKVRELAVRDPDPTYRARALWVWDAIEGASAAAAVLADAVNQHDPRIREQAVRILGRDCRDNGNVAPPHGQATTSLRPAQHHLDVLLPLADDLDSGIRRELILALRNVHDVAPSSEVLTALRKLAASWDGQDRWYLEALGLALEKRDSAFLSALFGGKLYGELSLEQAGRAGHIALPPYFPVDRNEAFIATGARDQAVTALSKYLGLAWRIHRQEALPLLESVIPFLRTSELQQAADDILERMNDPETAQLVAKLAMHVKDTARKQGLLAILARRLAESWHSTRSQAEIVQVIEQALRDPETRRQGIALAAATRDARYCKVLEALAHDEIAPEDLRVASVEALGSFRETPSQVLDHLITSVQGKPHSSAVAEAAARTIARRHDARDRLTRLIVAHDYPLGLRRESLRTLMQLRDGGDQVLELARGGKLPEDLKNDATTLLHTSSQRHLRDQAATVLPPPRTAAGKPLPPYGELIRRDGNPDKGRQVFFRAGSNSCSSCHRVQGRGQWVGPDLSTIGIKYGRDELIRSILSPGAAIGLGFRTLVVELTDGRVITGLPVEETPDRLVLKTAQAQRVALQPRSIESRRISDVSLMPEGLAQTMTSEELIDLLSYLTTLKQPVSIVGHYHVIGPLLESNGSALLQPASKFDLEAPIADGRGHQLSWRRASATAEGQVDLRPVVTGDAKYAAYVFTPVVSPIQQQATLVLDTLAEPLAWLNGKKLALTSWSPDSSEPRTATVDLPKGTSMFMIRVLPPREITSEVSLVTTFIAEQPVGFDMQGISPATTATTRR
jgi:putative heme-binding domain-containing protein